MKDNAMKQDETAQQALETLLSRNWDSAQISQVLIAKTGNIGTAEMVIGEYWEANRSNCLLAPASPVDRKSSDGERLRLLCNKA